jgi:hypothetical protein
MTLPSADAPYWIYVHIVCWSRGDTQGDADLRGTDGPTSTDGAASHGGVHDPGDRLDPALLVRPADEVHRDFAQVAIWQGGLVTQAGRCATTPEEVRAFAEGLAPVDEVALEATGNTWAIATLLASRAGRVVVSNPAKTRAIAEAKVKTDKVDAVILAQLLVADYLPAV